MVYNHLTAKIVDQLDKAFKNRVIFVTKAEELNPKLITTYTARQVCWQLPGMRMHCCYILRPARKEEN